MAGLIPFNRRNANLARVGSGFDDLYNMLDDFFSDNWMATGRNLLKDTFKIDIEEREFDYVVEAELPGAKKARYISEYGLPEYDTDIITRSISLAHLFEEANAVCSAPKDVSNWIMTELLRLMSDTNTLPEDLKFDFASLGKVIALVNSGKINRGTGKKVFTEVFANNVDPEQYVKDNNLALVTDTIAIRAELEAVVAANEKSVTEYKGGKEQAFQYLIGQGMRALRGKAPANVVAQLLHEIIEA